MSTTLYWRPVPKEHPPLEDLSSVLKYMLARRYWGHDGSLYGEEVEIGKEEIPYLQGLNDCGVEDADRLIAAIHDHGRVLIRIGA